MAKRILGIVKAVKSEDRHTKNAALATHTLRVVEARKRDAAKATAMITTRDLRRIK
jgi:hypothetical protein